MVEKMDACLVEMLAKPSVGSMDGYANGYEDGYEDG
jgi:hypothetical protein